MNKIHDLIISAQTVLPPPIRAHTLDDIPRKVKSISDQFDVSITWVSPSRDSNKGFYNIYPVSKSDRNTLLPGEIATIEATKRAIKAELEVVCRELSGTETDEVSVLQRSLEKINRCINSNSDAPINRQFLTDLTEGWPPVQDVTFSIDEEKLLPVQKPGVKDAIQLIDDAIMAPQTRVPQLEEPLSAQVAAMSLPVPQPQEHIQTPVSQEVSQEETSQVIAMSLPAAQPEPSQKSSALPPDIVKFLTFVKQNASVHHRYHLLNTMVQYYDQGMQRAGAPVKERASGSLNSQQKREAIFRNKMPLSGISLSRDQELTVLNLPPETVAQLKEMQKNRRHPMHAFMESP